VLIFFEIRSPRFNFLQIFQSRGVFPTQKQIRRVKKPQILPRGCMFPEPKQIRRAKNLDFPHAGACFPRAEHAPRRKNLKFSPTDAHSPPLEPPPSRGNLNFYSRVQIPRAEIDTRRPKTSNFEVRVKTKHERFEKNERILIFYHKILLF